MTKEEFVRLNGIDAWNELVKPRKSHEDELGVEQKVHDEIILPMAKLLGMPTEPGLSAVRSRISRDRRPIVRGWGS